MQNCRSLCVWGILLAFPAASSHAGDWPQFRGPAGDGSSSESNLATEWGPSKNVVWKQPIAGRGWSSPVVANGRIYLTTAVPQKDSGAATVSLRALCLDAGTGKTIWDTEVFGEEKGATRVHSKNSHASPTPVLCDGRLFVHFGHQGTACLDLEGKVLWRNQTLTYKPVHGNGGSPICVDELLVYSADGGDTRFVIALDARTGAVRWKTERTWTSSSRFSFSTPLAITVQGRKQIVSAGSDAVAAYDPADGKEIWRVRYAGGYSVIPKPIYANGLVYVCTGYAFPSLLAIRPDGRGDVTDTHVAWKAKKGVPNTPSILVVGNEIYEVSDGGLATCLDSGTGAVIWQERLGGHYSASPLIAGGRIYFQSEEGVGTVIKAGRKFEPIAKNDLDERSLASYAIADGSLFIRTEHHLYRVQPR